MIDSEGFVIGRTIACPVFMYGHRDVTNVTDIGTGKVCSAMVNDDAVKMAYDLHAYLFATGYDGSAHEKALETAKKLVAFLEEEEDYETAVS